MACIAFSPPFVYIFPLFRSRLPATLAGIAFHVVEAFRPRRKARAVAAIAPISCVRFLEDAKEVVDDLDEDVGPFEIKPVARDMHYRIFAVCDAKP